MSKLQMLIKIDNKEICNMIVATDKIKTQQDLENIIFTCESECQSLLENNKRNKSIIMCFSANDIRILIRNQIQANGSNMYRFASAIGIDYSAFYKFMRGKRGAPRKVISFLHLKRKLCYEKA